jgi:hypothetical protein
MKKAYRGSAGNPKGKDHSRDLRIDGNITLKNVE